MPANAAKRLIQHYVDNFRHLPWRSPPGEAPPEPYRVWLSEIMLQQTTVNAVAHRFERFLARWPTLEALAAAPDEAILSEWAGLGYYARARNLIACARQVAAAGGFPTSEDELRELPGIGDYTAAAIAAIAFEADTAPVDTNVERVLVRLHGIERPQRSQLRALLLEMTPPGRAGDLAQALMDLGAGTCRAKSVDCAACPLSRDCIARASGDPLRFRAARIKGAKPHRHGVAWWIEQDGALWLVRRSAKGLLGSMAALPGSDWSEGCPDDEALATVRHGFTHFTLDLAIVERAEPPAGEGWWQPVATIADAGLPTLYRRAVEAVLRGRPRLAA